MAINCDPGELVTLSKCFICLSPEQREAVKTYLLAVLAGGSLDPDVLMEEAKCWVCVPDQIALQNYLLCQAVNNCGGGGPATCEMLSGVGNPTVLGTTPTFIGQLFHDTNADTYYRSTGLTSADWTVIAGAPCPDPMIETTPAGHEGDWGITAYSGLPSITDIIWRMDETVFGFEIYDDTIESLTLPNLLSVDPLGLVLASSGITIKGDAFESISAPDLTLIYGDLDLSQDSALTTVDLPSLVSCNNLLLPNCTSLSSLHLTTLVTCATLFTCYGCSSLSDVSIPSFLPTNGKTVNFAACNLTAASVNHILARCVANPAYVSGLVDLSGGTNAAPTGQGILDKATLNARQPGLAVTN